LRDTPDDESHDHFPLPRTFSRARGKGDSRLARRALDIKGVVPLAGAAQARPERDDSKAV